MTPTLLLTQTLHGWHTPKVFYLAVCLDCGPPPIPVPFEDLVAADNWVMSHVAGTGHQVARFTEIRVLEA